MIPTRLTLRNFMSYGDEPQELDLSGLHVVCLSGDNGNGKSALLDAMTYALWGKTRTAGSMAAGEDDLVRLGAEELEVRLEFLLGDSEYRVIRKRNRRTRAGEWQAYLRTPDGAWLPIGGATMRETERRLASILRMEYETFLNSAYFQQGRADEFTRQKPDARKRILADILDLSRYDQLEEMARSRRSECDLAAKDLEGEIRHLEARAAEEATYRARLAEYEAALTHWTAERSRREEKLNGLRSALAVLQEKEQRLREREERLLDVRRECAQLADQLAAAERRMAEESALLARADQVAGEVQRLQRARELLHRLESDVDALNEARRQLTAAEGQLALRRQELCTQIAAAEAEWKRVEERRRRIAELEQRLADLDPKLAELAQAESEASEVEAQLEEATRTLAEMKARRDGLTKEVAEKDEILHLLESPRSRCPVCETDLRGRQEAAVLNLQGQKRALESALADLTRDAVRVKKRQTELKERMASLRERLHGVAALKAQRAEWLRSRAELIDQDAAAPQVLQALRDLRARLEKDAFGEAERAQIASLGERIGSLQASAAQYEDARKTVRELMEAQIETQWNRIQEAARNRERAEAEARAARENLQSRVHQAAEEEKGLTLLRAELSDQQSVRAAVQAAEAEWKEAAAAVEEAARNAERCSHQAADCAAAAALKGARAEERDRIVKDRQAYSDLAAAFGRRGVQALIIDNALPEIQDEANRLLARMTDSAMSVSLRTLREARARTGQIETLDIAITDDAGTRPYEMYSGGEAFRVSFALRIALSRLLARRAGASLQTLFIDEGFGTQDAKGRERLVEAIEGIRDEFRLILVITHVEELKDAFPSRIEVIRTPSGSRITPMD